MNKGPTIRKYKKKILSITIFIVFIDLVHQKIEDNGENKNKQHIKWNGKEKSTGSLEIHSKNG